MVRELCTLLYQTMAGLLVAVFRMYLTTSIVHIHQDAVGPMERRHGQVERKDDMGFAPGLSVSIAPKGKSSLCMRNYGTAGLCHVWSQQFMTAVAWVI